MCSAPDAMILRSLQHTGAGNYVILMWKTFFVAFIQAVFAAHQQGLCTMLTNVRLSWHWVAIGAACLSVAWLATLANLTTSSASALCLFYIAPLWAVPMGFLINDEVLRRRTVVAMALSMIGVLLIFAPNFVSRPEADPGHARHVGSIFGDMCGLISGLAFAGYLTTCRHASLHCPEAPLAMCGAIGTLAVVPPSAMMVAMRGDAVLVVSPAFLRLLAIDCACIAAYNIGTGIASRHLGSAELGLYLTLDCVFAPFLVWLAHGEQPSAFVLAGGCVLVCSLILHEVLAMRDGANDDSRASKDELLELLRTPLDGDELDGAESGAFAWGSRPEADWYWGGDGRSSCKHGSLSAR
jgi:drug/metabolite transporter (DMT)-like permease